MMMTHGVRNIDATSEISAETSSRPAHDLRGLMRSGSETVETWIDMQSIQPRVYMQIRNPPGPFLHRAHQPLECLFGVPQGGVNDAELVREDSLVAAHPL